MTVQEYLAELPADRRAALQAVRDVIRANLDRDFEEGMQYGMIGYYVPHRVFPPGYHCDPKRPLPFAGLASQKQHMSFYLISAYTDAGEEHWLRTAWAKTGKKLNMGKCCIRFKSLDDLPLELIGEAVRRVTVKQYVANYTATLAELESKRAARKAGGGAKSLAAKRGAASRPENAAAKRGASGVSKDVAKRGAASSASRSAKRTSRA